MLSSTDQIYTDRKEWDKIRADKIREISLDHCLSPHKYGAGCLPPSNSKCFTQYTDWKIEQYDLQFKD